jgi:hypothetical protein
VEYEKTAYDPDSVFDPDVIKAATDFCADIRDLLKKHKEQDAARRNTKVVKRLQGRPPSKELLLASIYAVHGWLLFKGEGKDTLEKDRATMRVLFSLLGEDPYWSFNAVHEFEKVKKKAEKLAKEIADIEERTGFGGTLNKETLEKGFKELSEIGSVSTLDLLNTAEHASSKLAEAQLVGGHPKVKDAKYRTLLSAIARYLAGV